jgi:hypothetical protein
MKKGFKYSKRGLRVLSNQLFESSKENSRRWLPRGVFTPSYRGQGREREREREVRRRLEELGENIF